MAHKKKMNQKKESLPYTIEDVLKITDEIFKLSKEKDYDLGAFVHGLIFALEYAQFSYDIPQQQIAGIKRDCRRYFKEMDTTRK
ncbi:MAG: hypothetical protein ACOC6D_05495 [Atribacterota bacterium]